MVINSHGFKIGDKVECISGFDNRDLQKGRVYEVSGLYDDGLYLKGINIGYLAKRFQRIDTESIEYENIPAFNPQPHYNNENGSIYNFCNDHGLNPWEADMIKRIVRCRKKGQFIEDLDKTKDLIDLYKIEYNNN